MRSNKTLTTYFFSIQGNQETLKILSVTVKSIEPWPPDYVFDIFLMCFMASGCCNLPIRCLKK